MLLHYLGAQIRDNRSNLDLGDCEGSLSGKTAPNLNKKAVNKNGEKHSSQRVYSGQMQEVRKSMLWELQPTGFHTSHSWTTSAGHPGKVGNVSLLYNLLLTYLAVILAPHLFSGDREKIIFN